MTTDVDTADRIAVDGDAAAADDVRMAALMVAVDPAAIGGVLVRARAGAARDAWHDLALSCLPKAAPRRRLPAGIDDERLLGGLDLGATLAAGRPVMAKGVLALAHGGVVLVPQAERLSLAFAARIAAVHDQAAVTGLRDGGVVNEPARFGILAFDEGCSADERLPLVLADRLAIHLDLDRARIAPAELAHDASMLTRIARAQDCMGFVSASDAALEALAAAAVVLGVGSDRALSLALTVARMAAALDGSGTVRDVDVARAARLVLAPRATRMPSAADQPPPPAPPPPGDTEAPTPPSSQTDQALRDLVVEAVMSALPLDLLQGLTGSAVRPRGNQTGRAAIQARTLHRGRPLGSRRGAPSHGARLDLLATLRAAAPWQRLRQSQRPSGIIAVRKTDFHVRRFRQPMSATTIFAVDASGSAALNRLAEAKGAVELLLADCYVRRDSVALLAFRGTEADVLLPPTRALVRVKRTLAALPGGGGTPIASGLDAARRLADEARRRGQVVTIVVLTDGRANIGRDGKPGRARAEADALASARALGMLGFTTLLIDASPRPEPAARRLADAMRATYVPLPYANAQAISRAVQSAMPQDRAAGRLL